jgi:nucleotide-binding universal stress UspA family protein
VEDAAQILQAGKASQLPYLTLDNLTADPKLARRLPPDLATRYHALPLTEDNGRITVVMADPEDSEGREAVVIAAGPAGGERCPPLVRRLLSRSTAAGVLASQQSAVPSSVLVAQRPRWPLERILLIICGENGDNAAVDWALRLAPPCTAAVTVLAVVPPVPEMYHGLSRMKQGVAALLATDTALGRKMHQVARRLAECKVDGTLRLRQGAPCQQVCRELEEGNHDLIVMATKPCRWWLRQLKGDPICSLLSRVDRPVVLAEPTTAYCCESATGGVA